MSRSDDRYDTNEYYRRKDEFYREQDLRHEHFQDDLRWEQEASARRHEFAREAMKEGNTPWALHWMGGTDHAIDLLRHHTEPAYRSNEAERTLNRLLDSAMRNLKEGAFTQAEKEFSQIIAGRSEFTPAYIHRATCRYCQKNFSGAIADCHTALRLEPGKAFLHFRRGRAYAGLGRIQDAIADYNKAIELDPSCDLNYYARGLLQLKQQNPIKAVADFDECIRLNPEWGTAYLTRGDCYLQKQDFKRALRDYEKAKELYKREGNKKMANVARKACRKVLSGQ